jgi:hypothetical protein
MWIKYPLAVVALATPLLVATGATAGATDLPAPTRTAPVVGTATAPPDRPVLTGVRHGRHDRYDRVVFDFAGGTPAYRVEYAPLVGVATGDPDPPGRPGRPAGDVHRRPRHDGRHAHGDRPGPPDAAAGEVRRRA